GLPQAGARSGEEPDRSPRFGVAASGLNPWEPFGLHPHGLGRSRWFRRLRSASLGHTMPGSPSRYGFPPSGDPYPQPSVPPLPPPAPPPRERPNNPTRNLLIAAIAAVVVVVPLTGILVASSLRSRSDAADDDKQAAATPTATANDPPPAPT